MIEFRSDLAAEDCMPIQGSKIAGPVLHSRRLQVGTSYPMHVLDPRARVRTRLGGPDKGVRWFAYAWADATASRPDEAASRGVTRRWTRPEQEQRLRYIGHDTAVRAVFLRGGTASPCTRYMVPHDS